jgi:hypothetical protein
MASKRGKTKHQCKHCKQEFSASGGAYNRHLEVCEYRWECPHCSKEFTKKSGGYKRHLNQCKVKQRMLVGKVTGSQGEIRFALIILNLLIFFSALVLIFNNLSFGLDILGTYISVDPDISANVQLWFIEHPILVNVVSGWLVIFTIYSRYMLRKIIRRVSRHLEEVSSLA